MVRVIPPTILHSGPTLITLLHCVSWLDFVAVHVFRCAIDFLESEFSQRNPQVKAVTSKGSELDTIAFRSEDPSGRKVCI